jgi:hypothetical protein
MTKQDVSFEGDPIGFLPNELDLLEKPTYQVHKTSPGQNGPSVTNHHDLDSAWAAFCVHRTYFKSCELFRIRGNTLDILARYHEDGLRNFLV